VIAGLLAADVAFAYQQTSIVPAVHDVEQSLGASPEWAAWLVTVYLIVATIATPAMGRLADRHGRRRMLLTGLGVFLAGSIGAAFAPDLGVLLACRAVQGVGGAVYPLTLALARRLLPPERASTAVALSAGVFGLGTVAGFAAGGLLAQYLSWRWIFVAGAVLVAVAWGCLELKVRDPLIDVHALLAGPVLPRQPGHGGPGLGPVLQLPADPPVRAGPSRQFALRAGCDHGRRRIAHGPAGRRADGGGTAGRPGQSPGQPAGGASRAEPAVRSPRSCSRPIR
jgi:MFS family permease